MISKETSSDANNSFIKPKITWFGRAFSKESLHNTQNQKTARLSNSIEKPVKSFDFNNTIDNKLVAFENKPSEISDVRNESQEPLNHVSYRFIKEDNEKVRGTSFDDSLKSRESFFSRLENKLKFEEDDDLDRKFSNIRL